MNTADRKRKRREYLAKKGNAYSSVTIAGLFVFIFSAAGILSGLFALATLIQVLCTDGGVLDLCDLPILLFLAVFFSVFAWACNVSLQEYQKTARSIPYIPPVTTDALPAEEVLVRGAEAPSTFSETLLRPASDSSQTPAEQLLRSTNGTGSELA